MDTLVKLEPAPYESALADAVNRVFQEKGLTFDAAPRHWSPAPAGTDIAVALYGAELMGYPLTPQGCYVARMLEARSDEMDPLSGLRRPLYEESAVELGRRSTKTYTIQAVLLGRCATIPNYRVVSTAQDGTRASQFFMNMVRMIEARMRRLGLTEADLGIRQIYRSQGREFIEWHNGSRWWVVKPESDAFRGEAADVMWFDEAQALDVAKSEDLVAGAFPLMDTRPLGQIIISGTPGMVRAGVFWDSLSRGRSDPETYGIVDFCGSDNDDITDEALWWVTHPGLASGLTTLAKMRRNLEKLGPLQFAREYLCIWPIDTTTAALDPRAVEDAWRDLEAFDGQDFDLAFDCHIHGHYAALAATWIDAAGEPHAQIMEYRAGTEWLVAELTRAQKAHPRIGIRYDAIGPNAAVALSLQRVPTFRASALQPVGLRDCAAGAALLAQHLDARTMHLGESAAVANAAANVTWRYSGESRLFGRKNASVCVAAVVAISIGLTGSLSRKARPAARRVKARLGAGG